MKREMLLTLALVLVTLAVFRPAVKFESVDFDDADYVFKNAYVQQGVTWQSVKWAFTTVYRNYWLPLTWVSYMADTDIQGSEPAGYHRTNVLLHALNAALLFLVLNRLTQRLWASAMAAALFAVHPLRIETVAWISDRKDLLSTVFWLLGIGAYGRYVEKPAGLRYALVTACMALGMMAKQMMVTFPFVLLLLDYWPLRRTQWKRLVSEKLPLFAASIVFSATTYLFREQMGSAMGLTPSSPIMRVLQAGLNYVAYIARTLWPFNLCFAYPPAAAVRVFPAIAACLGMLAVTALAVRGGRDHPYLPVGWLWFVGALVPVIGLIRVGNADIADRFTYVPAVGLCILAAWGAPDLVGRWPHRKSALGLMSAVALLFLAGATRAQLPYWRNVETLSRRALTVTKDNFVAWNSLGRAMDKKQRLSDAVACYEESLRIAPRFVQARLNLGVALGRMGRFEEAIRELEMGLRDAPRDASLHSNMGSVMFASGMKEEAFRHLREAVRLNPLLSDIHFNLAWGLLQVGKRDEALPEFEEAAHINPKDDVSHFYAGVLCAERREFDTAAAHLEKCVKLAPDKKEYRRALETVRLRRTP
jgi:protein O-mannosyl-transferase